MMSTSEPGLDLTHLLALQQLPANEQHLADRIRDHLDANDGYVACSGGKDSLVVTHLATKVDPNVPVVFFDSGLEYPETYTYLTQLRQHLDLQLHIVPAQPPLLELLVASGTWDHHAANNYAPASLHDTLIVQPAAVAHEQFGPGELWGVRARESRGRAALYATSLRRELTHHGHRGVAPPTRHEREAFGGVVRRRDGTVAFGPIWNWRTAHVWSYIARHRLPVNPVYDRLRRLGAPEHAQRLSHLLDGARLEHGRMTWLRRGWPALFHELSQALPRIREFT
jgi:phosphoadenosine phosphosulfate reductase